MPSSTNSQCSSECLFCAFLCLLSVFVSCISCAPQRAFYLVPIFVVTVAAIRPEPSDIFVEVMTECISAHSCKIVAIFFT